MLLFLFLYDITVKTISFQVFGMSAFLNRFNMCANVMKIDGNIAGCFHMECPSCANKLARKGSSNISEAGLDCMCLNTWCLTSW